MAGIKPVDFHGFAGSLELLFIEFNRSCRCVRIMILLDDQHLGLTSSAYVIGELWVGIARVSRAVCRQTGT